MPVPVATLVKVVPLVDTDVVAAGVVATEPPEFISIWLKVWAEPILTWNHMPDAWAASEL